MKTYKYMITCGIGGFTVVGNNKAKLMKEYKECCENNYAIYLETMEYLGEKPEITIDDFYEKENLWVEEFCLDHIDIDDTIHEIK